MVTVPNEFEDDLYISNRTVSRLIFQLKINVNYGINRVKNLIPPKIIMLGLSKIKM